MTHYLVMNGEHGCMPDNLEVHDTLQSAVESAASLFDLGRNRTRELKRNLYLELTPNRDGASYVEIQECDCTEPEIHAE